MDNKYNTNIFTLPADESSVLNNGWLPGMIENDGYFGVFIRNRKIGKNLKVYTIVHTEFRLSQRQLYHRENDINIPITYKLIMEKMCNAFETNLHCKNIRNNPQYWFSVHSYKQKYILIEYLEKFNLYSTKRLDFMDWNKVLQLRKETRVLNSQVLKQCMSLTSNLNENRKNIDWSHLNLLK